MSRKPGKEERSHWAFEFGTDREYLEWIMTQPSCLSGSFSEWHDGQGFSVAAHVRTVKAGAGTSFKPKYSAVPLTDSEHRLQHQHGYEYFRPLDWWEEQVAEHLVRWVSSRQFR